MDILFGALVVLGMAAVTASTVAVLVAQWRAFRTAFRRIRPERRRPAFMAGAGALVYGVGVAALLIAAPLGRTTWIVVFGTVAVVMLLLMIFVVVNGLRGGR